MSYANDMTRANGALASDLRIAVMRLARRLRAERADLDLSISQLAALASLERNGPSTPGILAAMERVQPPSMTRTIAGLEARGLVVRSPHATDGRQVVVEVTDEARSILRADRRRREAWLAQRLGTLTPEDLTALREVAPILERLVAE